MLTSKIISSKTFASGIVGAIQESTDNLVIDGKYIISDNVSTTASENITANCVAEIVYDNFSGRNENVTVENNLVFPTEDGVVFDGENYYSSLAAALKGVNGKDNAVLYCKPGADVGSMTHGHVCKNLTVYGNGAYISGGEQEFEIDTYLCTGAGGSALEGDVTLTVFQSIPLDGIVMVTSPQELVSLVVAKAVNMAKTMEIPIIGLVENMSYAECPDCGKKIEIFGKSKTEETAKTAGLEFLARVPFCPSVASLTDAGEIEKFSGDYFDKLLDKIEKML